MFDLYNLNHAFEIERFLLNIGYESLSLKLCLIYQAWRLQCYFVADRGRHKPKIKLCYEGESISP